MMVLRSSTFGSLVTRVDLQHQLTDCLTRKLTLIVAPAGYGKTTLIRQLLQVVPPTLHPSTYTLDETDNDPAHLLNGLRCAVSAGLTGGKEISEVDENQGSLSYPLSVIFRKAAELTQSDWLLILDDYHTITNPAVHEALDALLNLPTWPVHLVIASRVPPPFVTAARLRIEGQLVEIDERDLRFTPSEILNLFEADGLSLDETQLLSLARRTEGWPAALRLVCQASHHAAPLDLETLLDRMGDENAIFDYLAGQVLNRQPLPVRHFLCRTAILPYFSVSLCDAFLDTTDSSAILDTLRRSHLFITPLAEAPDPLYRFHVLFAGFLRRCLEQDEGSLAVRALHRRAAQCFMQLRTSDKTNQIANFEIAIQQWIAAGEFASAADAVESVAELLDWGQLYTLEKWFEALPVSMIEGRPRLLVALGLLREKEGRWNEALKALEQASQVLTTASADPSLLSRVWVRQAWVYHRQGQYERVSTLCRQALDVLGDSEGQKQDSSLAQSQQELADVYLILGANEYETGHLDEAIHADEKAIQLFRETGDRIGETRAVSHLAYVYGNLGRLTDYIEAELTTLRLYDEMGSFRATSSLIGLADAYRQLGDYDRSRDMLDRSMSLVDANPDPLMRGYTLFLLGHWQRERGESAAAHSSYEEARAIGEKLREPTLLGEPRRGLALLALDEGDLREAMRQAETTLLQMRSIGHRAMEGQALITFGLVQEAAGDPSSAEASLRGALQLYLNLGDSFALANIYLYLADLYRSTGRVTEALPYFSQSLTLSRRYGYDSLFTLRERSRALPLLIAALPGPFPPESTAELIRLLNCIGEVAVDSLLGLLEKESLNMPLQKRIIEMLGKIGDERAIPTLERLSRKGPVKEVSTAALHQIAQHPAPALRVLTLGGFQVLRGNLAIAASVWQQRRKTRILFLYLLAHRPRQVPRDELLEALWPDLAPNSASLALNTTFSDLRKLLEPFLGKGMPSRYLAHEGECYWVIPSSDIWYDVQAFEKAAQAGASTLRAAQELYRGDFLPEEPYLDWVIRERERMRSTYLNLLMATLDQKMHQGAWHEGIDLARHMIEQEPWLEEVWRAQMTCLVMLGRRSEALQVYLTGACSLRDELGVEPSSETRVLYEQLKG